MKTKYDHNLALKDASIKRVQFYTNVLLLKNWFTVLFNKDMSVSCLDFNMLKGKGPKHRSRGQG